MLIASLPTLVTLQRYFSFQGHALTPADVVVRLEPRNAKGHTRRGTALLSMGSGWAEEAADAFAHALKVKGWKEISIVLSMVSVCWIEESMDANTHALKVRGGGIHGPPYLVSRVFLLCVGAGNFTCAQGEGMTPERERATWRTSSARERVPALH